MKGNPLFVAILLLSAAILPCAVTLAQEQLPPADSVINKMVSLYKNMDSIEFEIESHMEVNLPSQGLIRNDSKTMALWFSPPLLRIDEPEAACASYVVHVSEWFAYCANARGEWKRVVLDAFMEPRRPPTRVSELFIFPTDFPFTRIEEVHYNGHPVWLVEGTTPGSPNVTMRLWIDRESYLIRAEETLLTAYDDDMNPVETIRFLLTFQNQIANPEIPEHVFDVPHDAPWEASIWGRVLPHRLPDAKAQTLSGKTVSLTDLLGRVTIYYIWDYETVAQSTLAEKQTVTEMLSLNSLHESFAEKGLRVVGVCLSSCEHSHDRLNALGVKFEQLVMDKTQIASLHSSVVPIADPYLLVVDHRGYLRYAGNDDTTALWANLEKIVSNLLDEE